MIEKIVIGNATLYHGDCLEVMRTLPDCSVDAVVTDPPYGLAFMGKRWDYDVPTTEVWAECLRVLKPGGHLLAFAGTRTQHRMAVRIEDAGFEIRDMIAWVYGSGFPKSLDVSKAIDKGHGDNRDRQLRFTAWMRSTGITARQIDDITATKMGNHYTTHPTQPAIATADMFDKLRPYLPEVPEEIERLVCERTGLEWTAYKNREVVGQGWRIDRKQGAVNYGGGTPDGTYAITAPATEAARAWQGWGTALKPALEPITVARKPLIGTVAENVLAHGTGALNVDGCRVGTTKDVPASASNAVNAIYGKGMGSKASGDQCSGFDPNIGRWPANLIHDGSDEVVGLAGDAARFFYCAKASKADREKNNNHPTVKPTALMQYLCRLVTPPGGTVLDPFMGSGSTGKAAKLEGVNFLGIEREHDYLKIAHARIEAAELNLGFFK